MERRGAFDSNQYRAFERDVLQNYIRHDFRQLCNVEKNCLSD